MKLSENLADRLNELQIPKGDPNINRILGEWMNLGGLLIVRDLPDGYRSLDLFLPPGIHQGLFRFPEIP